MGALEHKVGYLVCPLNVESKGNPRLLVRHTDSEYRCAMDGDIARGGNDSLSIPQKAVTPCSLKYAENCPLFQQYRSEKPFIFEEGGGYGDPDI